MYKKLLVLLSWIPYLPSYNPKQLEWWIISYIYVFDMSFGKILMGQGLFSAGLPPFVCKYLYSFILYSCINQWFWPGTDFATQEMLAMSVRTGNGSAPGMWWVVARDAAKHLRCIRTAGKSWELSSVSPLLPLGNPAVCTTRWWAGFKKVLTTSDLDLGSPL